MHLASNDDTAGNAVGALAVTEIVGGVGDADTPGALAVTAAMVRRTRTTPDPPPAGFRLPDAHSPPDPPDPAVPYPTLAPICATAAPPTGPAGPPEAVAYPTTVVSVPAVPGVASVDTQVEAF